MADLPPESRVLGPAETAAALPWPALLQELVQLLLDDQVHVPARLVQPLPGGGSLFVMPAHDARIAITKLITFTPANTGSARPTIQGDVIVTHVATGTRALLLDGPTVTARRTAAVSALAAQRLAPRPEGPLLIVGAGVQGRAHLDAFADVLGVKAVVIASRSEASADALARHAQARGLQRRNHVRPGRGAGRLPAGGDLHARQRRGAARPARPGAFHRRRGRLHTEDGGTRARAVPPCRADRARGRGYPPGPPRSRRLAAGGAGREPV
jgi:hypothetical protein